MTKIEAIQEKLRAFAKERDWEKFHSPKNLAMALSAESGELLEIFQWLTDEQSKAIIADPKEKKRVEEELADVFLYLLRLADQLGIDLMQAAESKMALNAEKYPIATSKGSATKYNRK